jgi:hypothetical protein
MILFAQDLRLHYSTPKDLEDALSSEEEKLREDYFQFSMVQLVPNQRVIMSSSPDKDESPNPH